MDKKLKDLLPAFGQSIASHLYQYLTETTTVTSKYVVFMAGSPAAGKTELLTRLIEQNDLRNFVRIDADDFRWWFPYYNEKNAALYQKSASSMVETTYLKALVDGYPIIMDSTLASKSIAEKNFQRAIRAGYRVMVNYVYFDPELAWQYARARSRPVPLDILKINFFKSRETIIHLLDKYPGDFTLNVYHRRLDHAHNDLFMVDFISGVTKHSWDTSHHCPYAGIDDLSHLSL